MNPLLENNSIYNENLTYNIIEKENEELIKIKKEFVIIGVLVIDKEINNTITKSLINKFVAIYLDDYMKINDKNVENNIENTEIILNKQIKESLDYYQKIKNE